MFYTKLQHIKFRLACFWCIFAFSLFAARTQAGGNMQRQKSFNNAFATDEGGKYAGTLYNIHFKNKTGFPRQKMFFMLTRNHHIRGTLPRIGKMPGVIHLDIPVKIDDKGKILPAASENQPIGIMEMKMLFAPNINLYFNGAPEAALSGASLTHRKLSFTLKMKGKFIITIPAQISFASSAFYPYKK